VTTSLPGSTQWEACKCKPGFNGTVNNPNVQHEGIETTCAACPPGKTQTCALSPVVVVTVL